VETSNDANVPRKPLTLVVQLPEFTQLDVVQRRPAAEEKRHAFITSMPRIAKLTVAEPREVLWKVVDHRGTSAVPCLSGVRSSGRLPAELPQPLPDPCGQAMRDLHEAPRFRRPRRSGR
jgi:hypothetical protein